MENTTSKVTYLGDLRTEAIHIKSQKKVINDAPVDNQGKGEAFSPTDMTATSLATCMLTIMGINAKDKSIDITGSVAKVTKVMASNPRRIAEIHIHFCIPNSAITEKEKTILENAALNCPVAKSIHPDIIQKVNFEYV